MASTTSGALDVTLYTSRLRPQAGRLAAALVLAALIWFLTFAPLRVAAAALAGAAVLIAVLREPRVGLLLLPLTVPFGSVAQVSLAGAAVGPTEALLGLTAAAWLARGVVNRDIHLDAPALTIPLLVWWAAMLVSMTNARAAAPALKELVKWAEIFAAYVLTYNLIRDRRAARALCGALLLAGLLSGLHGTAGAVLKVGPAQFATLGGRLYRASGTFAQPNPFGGYMNHTLPLAASLLLAVLLIGRQSLVDYSARLAAAGSALVLATAAVTGVGLILSWSRGAWLGAAAGLTLIVLGWAALLLGRGRAAANRRLRGRLSLGLWLTVALVLLLLAVGGLRLFPGAISMRVESALSTFTSLDVRGADITNANFATLERVAHWQAAWNMWRAHFWTGVGAGNYAAAYPDYRLSKWAAPLGHAHNLYFNIGAETGLLGLLAYLLFAAAAAWHIGRVAARADEWLTRSIAVGALGVLGALAIHNFFDNLYVHAMGVHLALVLGLVSALDGFGRQRTK